MRGRSSQYFVIRGPRAKKGQVELECPAVCCSGKYSKENFQVIYHMIVISGGINIQLRQLSVN